MEGGNMNTGASAASLSAIFASQPGSGRPDRVNRQPVDQRVDAARTRDARRVTILDASHKGQDQPDSSCPVRVDPLLADQLIDTARIGNARQVMRYVATLRQNRQNDDECLNLMLARHGKTGDTALHAAIQNNHVDVVGAIAKLALGIGDPHFHGDRMSCLLARQNAEGRSPLEIGGLTPDIKAELLAMISYIVPWPYCHAHDGYTVFPFWRECGCKVCDLCPDVAGPGGKCTICGEVLKTQRTIPDYDLIQEARQDIREYSVLFNGQYLPVCPDCGDLAFPPFELQCGHVLCYTCASKPDKTCRMIDNLGNRCQQSLDLESIRLDKAASQQFVYLFCAPEARHIKASSPSSAEYRRKRRWSSLPQQNVRKKKDIPGRSAAVAALLSDDSRDDLPHSRAALSALRPRVMGFRIEIRIVNDIAVETCPHLSREALRVVMGVTIDAGTPARYAIPTRNRVSVKHYGSDTLKNLCVEQLEYRLVPYSHQVTQKLEHTMMRVRIQQEEMRKQAQSEKSEKAESRGQSSHPEVMCYTSEQLSDVNIACPAGQQPAMEAACIADCFTITIGTRKVPVKILGVFDGYETNEMANYIAQNITRHLASQLTLHNTDGLTDAGIWNAIKIAFVNLSNSYPPASGSGSGSDACVALIIRNNLWVANLGLSRADLIVHNTENNRKDQRLSEAAEPKKPGITPGSVEKRGGFVTREGPLSNRYLVNGVFASTRALGAHRFRGAVSSRPKITRYPLTGFSGCLVLSSRGVTDTLTTEMIGNITRTALLGRNDSNVNIAGKIVKASLEAGATNHISVITITLRGRKKDEASDSGIVSSRENLRFFMRV